MFFVRLPKVILIILAFLTKSISSDSGEIKCKDESGNSIDWFFAYKLPRDHSSSDAGFREGSAYFMMTPDIPAWQRSSRSIDHNDSILAKTLEPLYRTNGHGADDVSFVLYNDQPPLIKPMIRNGHTKGLVLASMVGTKGIFLQHSVPHFPLVDIRGPNPASYYYPPGGLENGQMFLCLSLNLSEVDKIGEALEYTKPDVYNYVMTDVMAPLLPKLTQVVRSNATRKSAPWFTTFNFQAGTLDFTVFVKGPKFRKEIYGDWISPTFSTALAVQSWLIGSHPIHSDCNITLSTRNILEKEISKKTFSASDHSKWAVATSPQKQWVCVGDLNRMKPQKTRGGIALCTSESKIWNAFKTSVDTLQPCSATGLEIWSRKSSTKKHKKRRH